MCNNYSKGVRHGSSCRAKCRSRIKKCKRIVKCCKKKKNDPCYQLKKAIDEQKSILEYLDAQIMAVGDKIKLCSEALDGAIDTAEEDNIQKVVDEYLTNLNNLVTHHQQNMTILQAMVTEYANCGNVPI